MYFIFPAIISLVISEGMRKLGIIDDVASKKLSRLILMVGQPAMIIHSMAKADYSELLR